MFYSGIYLTFPDITRRIIILSLIFLLSVCPFDVFPEGSKEVYIGTQSVTFYLCNDFTNKCNPPTNPQGDRCQFAIYGCSRSERLYFITTSPNETVYLGFNSPTSGTGGNQQHTVWRIKDHNDNIVYPPGGGELTAASSGRGFISSISNARIGPTEIPGNTGGYEGADFHPAAADTFYIEFNRKNSSGNVVTTNFNMDLIDITVYDSVAAQVKTGRLFCKAWQFQVNNTAGQGYSGTNYIYSTDSIITSAAFSSLQGGVWIQFCNHNGCANTGNFTNDRKSIPNQQAFFPEYRVFLNSPDQTLFPPAKVLGSIIGTPTYQRNCSNGSVDFNVTVDKAASVEIILSFGAPYTNDTIATTVIVGSNTITWDGLDGSSPTRLPVPNNRSITFTVNYINGLTNLPLYDVETNSNGFTIGLVSPATTIPKVYWDDRKINNGTANLNGCQSPPGCHSWVNSWGDHHTINTWWYTVSSPTSPATFVEFRNPQLITFQTTPINACSGANNVTVTVVTEPNTETYNWGYTGTGATFVPSATTTTNSVTVNFAPNATSGNITVYGTNTNCNTTPGPTSSLAVTILPNPVPVITGLTSVCLNSSATYSTASGMSNYIWNVTGGTKISGGTSTDNTVTITWNTLGTQSVSVSYTNANNCTAVAPTVYNVTVQNLPVPTLSGPTNACISNVSDYTTQSGATSYTWDLQPLTGRTIISGGGANDDHIQVQWDNAGTYVISVNYTVGTGCTAPSPTTYNVVVNPSPSPVISAVPASASPCGNTQVTYSVGAALPNHAYLWTISGGTPASGNGSGIVVTWGNTNPVSVDVVESITYAPGVVCSAHAPAFPVTLNLIPDAAGTISGPSAVCQGLTKTFSVNTINNADSYTWWYTPSTDVTYVNNGNNADFTFGLSSASGNLFVQGNKSGCASGSASPAYAITIHNPPTVTLTGCNDPATTTTSRSFALQGGLPPGTGGQYFIDGVATASGIFDPSALSPMPHQITYKFTDFNSCSNTSSQFTINVITGSSAGSCPLSFTDPRDSRSYSAFILGSRCWMLSNLNYGAKMASDLQSQSDNCISEKYCPAADASCSNYGGLYQWDELIQYQVPSSVSVQGLCPPEWHIPTQLEWQGLIDAIAGMAYGDGIAGSYLKDPNQSNGFHALLDGIYYLNNTWAFTSGNQLNSTIFWTSTTSGTSRAIARGMNNYNYSVSFYPSSRANAFPVRCVKD